MKHTRWLGAFLALLLLAATVARADEGYTLPGTACKGGGLFVEHRDGYISFFTDEDQNGEDDWWLRVNCPVLRRGPDTSSVYSIFAKVDDGNSGDEVSCFATSCIASGFNTTCAFGGTASSSGRGTGIQLALGTITGFNGGSAWITCDIPDHHVNYSKIKSYNWND